MSRRKQNNRDVGELNEGTKLYTHKVPKRVRVAMKLFTQSDCYLVKRRRSGKTSEGKVRNCHTNVAYWVDKIGGESVDGWVLHKDTKAVKNGCWGWNFHSVWKTPEGKLVDVTQNSLYEGKTHITFWKDKNRRFNVVDGVSYNSVFVFANQRIAEHYSAHSSQRIHAGKIYWTNMCTNKLKSVNEHSGEFRLLTPQYPTNLKLLKDKTGIEIRGREVVCPKHSKTLLEASNDWVFDFSLSTNKMVA